MSKTAGDASASTVAANEARKFFVEGHVQGVFFREWTVGKAREMGISGWVRNLSDGRVEVYAIGDHAVLDRLAAQLRKGSPASIVKDVATEPAEMERINGFSRRQSV